jgi:hypothetical protein
VEFGSCPGGRLGRRVRIARRRRMGRRDRIARRRGGGMGRRSRIAGRRQITAAIATVRRKFHNR